MPWSAVYLTLLGIKQKEESFRRLGQVMVDLWSDKQPRIEKIWPLPFDGPSEDKSTFDRLKQRLIELKQKQQNGSN
jgi:hypothetical protein